MSHQVIQKIGPNINSLPNEIRWDIFDDLIQVPLYFATTYTGDSWTRDAKQSMESDGFESYKSLERQRKVVGSVCRSWQLWARARKHRNIHLAATETTVERDLERAFEARRVWILPSSWPVVQPVLGGRVNWEILTGHTQLIADFPPISHPRLRRVRLTAIDNQPVDPNTFLLALERFKDITWLDYEISGESSAPKSIDVNTSRVIMPNLQVLYYRTLSPLQLPLSYITMPSLRYLAIHHWNRSNAISLNDIILAFGQTLQSFIFQMHSVWTTETVRFPPWSKLPKLEELVLSHRLSIQFDPIPPTHPLKKLVARHASFDALPSFLDAANMRQLLILGAQWLTGGRMVLNGNYSAAKDVNALEEKARMHGIRLATSNNDQSEDKFVTREEQSRIQGEAKK
jgi:hypothetical protein